MLCVLAAGRPFRESFSPFWPEQDDGAARFQEACDEWRAVVVRGLEMCESQGMLKCPATRCASNSHSTDTRSRQPSP